MPSTSDNLAILAGAGTGKTTRLVNEALSDPNRRFLIVTYTNNNVSEIRARFERLPSGLPRNVDLKTWYTFLLQECARPYQHIVHSERIRGIQFVTEQSARRIPETNVRAHYLTRDARLYSDKVSKFAVRCEHDSGGLVTRRLCEIYTDILIDEFQDLAGWDLEVVKMLLAGGVRVMIVGDPRQHTYATHPSRKNRQFLGPAVTDLLREWETNGLCSLEFMTESHRCSSDICRLSSAIWPDLPPITSRAESDCAHAGLYAVKTQDVPEYIARVKPQVLRHDKRAPAFGAPALNYGASKGLEFPHVLIVPTAPVRGFLNQLDATKLPLRSRSSLYVALTRAEHSVAFVVDHEVAGSIRVWNPDRAGE